MAVQPVRTLRLYARGDRESALSAHDLPGPGPVKRQLDDLAQSTFPQRFALVLEPPLTMLNDTRGATPSAGSEGVKAA